MTAADPDNENTEGSEPPEHVFVPGGRRRRATASECWRIWTAMAFVVPAEYGIGALFRILGHPALGEPLAKLLAFPVCFFAGVAWHRSHRERRRVRLHLAAVWTGIVLVALPLVIGAIITHKYLEDVRVLRSLTSLRDKPPTAIVVVPWLAEEVFGSLQVRDKEALREFALCARDARLYREKDSRLGTPMWYLRVDGPHPVELMCYYREERPDRLVGHIGRRLQNGGGFRTKVRFISTNLRPWFEKHVENATSHADGQEASSPVH